MVKEPQILKDLTPLEKQELVKILEEKEDRIKYNRLSHFKPYPWQTELANATKEHRQVLAMTANQIGKSTVGAYITAIHLTGLYPEWWDGRRYTKPLYAWAAGVSTDTTRDIMQSELFGLAEDDSQWGTGMVPLACCGEKTRRRGATGNTYDSVMVQWHDASGTPRGRSRLGFKSYEMGEEKFFGRPVDLIWLDEQPPSNIYTQCITRTVATAGDVLMTFTPEQGITPVVHQFMHERQAGQYLLTATWDDAPHLTEEVKKQLLGQYPPHERALRSQGIPVFGSGLVFPIAEGDITSDWFEIPDEWPKLAAIDFGYDHPTAIVWLAYDKNSDCIYIYDEHVERQATPVMLAPTINQRPHWIPMVWPRDGLQVDKGSGISLADQYKQQGVNMQHTWFTNPPTTADTSGKGTINIEPGIMEMLSRMETGRLKVFPHLMEFWKEFRAYHRKDGKIFSLNDDVMSASRYGVQSIIRFGVAGRSANSGYGLSGDLPLRNYSLA